jgi:hypothetical protein
MIQLKKPLTVAIGHVFSKDKAIDTSSPLYNFEKFVETGDLAHLPKKDGQEYTVFMLRPLPVKALKACYRLSTEHGLEALETAVRYSLQDIKNATWADDERIEVKRQSGQYGECVADATMEIFVRCDDLLLELGRRALDISKISPL